MDVLDIARFWSKVDVKRSAEMCWLWKDKPDSDGYGEVKLDGKSQFAHRVAFALAYGDPPAGSVVRHSCDKRLCCNPKHLLSGTHADNVRDRVLRNRSARGSRNGRAILDEAAVLSIRQSEEHPMKLARAYGVSTASVMAVRSRKSWKHI